MRITLPSGTEAELARPVGPTPPSRGLVLAPDIMGLRPLFDGHCRRLAEEQGWVVCAPEPFAGRESLALEERLGAVGELVDAEVVGDLVAAADACAVEPVGVLGFCMGGMYTLKAAGTGRFDRAVAFYGMIRIPEQWRGAGQGEPLDALARPEACPVLAVVGTDDPWTPAADIDALAATGAVVVRYQGADHGFVHDPDRPAHRPDDAAEAWARAVTFLAAG